MLLEMGDVTQFSEAPIEMITGLLPPRGLAGDGLEPGTPIISRKAI